MLTDLGRSAANSRPHATRLPSRAGRLEAISKDQLRSILRGLISRIEISRERIKVLTRALEFEQLLDWDFAGLFRRRTEDTNRSPFHVIDVPCAGAIRLERRLRLPIVAFDARDRINRGLTKLVTEAREAWAAIEKDRDLSPADIAAQWKVTLSYFMRLLRVCYLAPDILTSIMDGTQPRELTRRTLLDANLPLDWALQRAFFGFPEQPPMRSCESYRSADHSKSHDILVEAI